MSRLSELPEREKDPGEAVSLSEVFRTKEYLAEIKGALKKGYTFGEIAEIFTERCGASVSERQMKYHYTREKNRRAKNNAAGKSKQQDTPEGKAAPENSAPMAFNDGLETDTESAANVPPTHAPKPAAFDAANGGTEALETGAFFFEKRP
jgi:hypothetical protein